ncbi:MAG: RNA polymerase sporulation sigma factor SigG, partial [Clostridia bacterium]|nr:RNA polymerase sporulation sigma factor SigG [Clostridia bacterium]
MINKVEICGVNTSTLRVLSNEEKAALMERIREGDRDAREEFINGNLRLVLSIIQRFYNRGEAADDLFQVGCVGLIKAIDNFDTSHGVLFSTYAVPMIIGEIRRYLRDNNSIRVSRSMRDTAYKALGVREKMINRDQKEPTVDEIAREMGQSKEDVVFALEAICDPVSLYEPIYSDGGNTIYVMDQVKDDKNSDEVWLEHIALREAMERLGDRERQILKLRFFEGRTQMEVAADIGISQAQVSRLEKSAISHVKKNI